MIDHLSRYVFEVLRKDEEFILYHAQSADLPSRFLRFRLRWRRPRPESLKRLEHEYSLRGELDPIRVGNNVRSSLPSSRRAMASAF